MIDPTALPSSITFYYCDHHHYYYYFLLQKLFVHTSFLSGFNINVFENVPNENRSFFMCSFFLFFFLKIEKQTNNSYGTHSPSVPACHGAVADDDILFII